MLINMETPLRVEVSEGIAQVVLNRPEVHNAFNESLIQALTQTFEAFREDDSVRVVVLRGEGKSFCAGADLNWMGKMVNYSFQENLEDARALARMFGNDRPLSQARDWACAMARRWAAGRGLVAVCDVAIATARRRVLPSAR